MVTCVAASYWPARRAARLNPSALRQEWRWRGCSPTTPLILVDEPTDNLDPETAESVMGFLAELNRERSTIVRVTHDQRLAGRAQRALRLANGSIQPDGRPLNRPAQPHPVWQPKPLTDNDL